VDDGSIDGTPELAQSAGARVITSTLLGKGASMEDGMLAARHDTLLSRWRPRGCDDLVEGMTEPVCVEADSVSQLLAARRRVTALTPARCCARIFRNSLL
jgi:glycosyltransferase involved in cell wall biosynthesis